MATRIIKAARSGKRTRRKSVTAPLSGVRAQLESQPSPSGILPLLDCYGTTEVGRRRNDDQDDFVMAGLPLGQDLRFDQALDEKQLVPAPGQTGFLFLVADGVGGVPCGDRASSMAVKSLSGYLKGQPCLLEKGRLEITRVLRRGIRRCLSDLHAEIRLHPECDGMSTTLTGALLLLRRLYVVHSGDSRCYILRGSHLSLVTHDHTQAQVNIEAGRVDRKVARSLFGGNRLWNYLTSDASTLRPDVGSILLEPGDILLLCTDGLTDSLPAGEIQRLLSSRASAEGICKTLVAAARGKGGGDDLTAIVARFGGTAK